MQTRFAVLIAVFGLGACRVVEPPPPPDAPRITAFSADKQRIASGESAMLSFSTTGASKVSITDDRGGSVEISGDAANGTATVAPRASAFYVLRAVGDGGADTAFVQIAVNEPLKDIFLVAVPASVTAGGTAQLLWGATGASAVTLRTNGGAAQTLTGTTGTVAVTPARSSEYLLSAQGAPGTPAITALARVAVTPIISAFRFDAINGVKAGEPINFTWATGGATRLVLSERTFGQLTTITDEAALDTGTFDSTLPATLPNGFELTEGLLLHFTLTAFADDVSVARTASSSIGERPAFEQVTFPEAATVGTQFTVSWRTVNATRLAVLAGGQPVFETLPTEQARVTAGSVRLPAPTAQTEYTIVAGNDTGLEARQVHTVRSVALPVINTFTITGVANTGGDPVTARWTTANATRVALRVESGATLAEVTNAAQVASGMATVRALQSLTVVLEAFNAAGDVARARQAVVVNSPLVTVSPDPVVRGDTATLTWDLAALGVTEVVGLATPTIEVVGASSSFIDLATASGVQSLLFADPADGAEKLPAVPGFEFRLLNQARPDLYVSVNGFISYGPPAALGTNLDVLDGGAAPSLLAPFWDDLQLGADSEVLYAVQTRAGTNEKFLVVQWDRVQLAADPMSELTFQAHLYETGQVSFHYKTLNGAVNSATTAVKEASRQVALQYAFNGAPTTVVPDLELNFFNAGTADGVETFTAGPSERITFYGRTAQSVLPASALVRSFGPGDVSVTEAMPLPDPSTGSSGQWVELRNNAAVTVDLGGLAVETFATGDAGFIIPPGTNVDAGGFLVIGQSDDVQANGGAHVDLVDPALLISVPDQVKVTLGATTLGQLAWDAGTQSTSILSAGSGSVLYASGATVQCNRMVTYGPNGAFGSPGAANESCAPYTLESIPPGYIDISTTGTRLLATASDYTGIGTFPLAQAFTYFDQSYTSFNISMCGFITFGPALTSAYDVTNATVPSSALPNGTVAIFWDQIVRNTGGALFMREDPDRTIISWNDFRIYATTSSMWFQIHLLRNGAIEFHYHDQTSATQSTRDSMTGTSATSWLESPDGMQAVPLNINTLGGTLPNTSFRFTPAP